MDEQSDNGHQRSPSRASVGAMFDRIAPRYDLLNRLLSFRRDVAWRRRVADFLPEHSGQSILDIATGTADLLLSLFDSSDRISDAIGVDLAPTMLELGRRKVIKHQLDDRVLLVRADALRLPFADRSFDAVTIAFGIRNMTDVLQSLTEMLRVLMPGGKVLILEFSMPVNPLVRRLYPLHLRGLLPLLGAMISGDSYAYRYLNRTVETFPYGEQFCSLMREAGFTQVATVSLTFGIATIYHGCKLHEDEE